MKRAHIIWFLAFAVFAFARAAESKEPVRIAIIIIYSESGTATSAERVELPAGLHLSELFKKERTFKLRRPISWAQGSVELRRLPGPGKAEASFRFAQIEVRRTTKADIPLEHGDIVISDMLPDL